MQALQDLQPTFSGISAIESRGGATAGGGPEAVSSAATPEEGGGAQYEKRTEQGVTTSRSTSSRSSGRAVPFAVAALDRSDLTTAASAEAEAKSVFNLPAVR
eukprot:COSAG06_NODE_44065_length_366_cov_1.037453_1_plen_101_part_01